MGCTPSDPQEYCGNAAASNNANNYRDFNMKGNGEEQEELKRTPKQKVSAKNGIDSPEGASGLQNDRQGFCCCGNWAGESEANFQEDASIQRQTCCQNCRTSVNALLGRLGFGEPRRAEQKPLPDFNVSPNSNEFHSAADSPSKF